ncbi:MAG: hypothetical protein B7Z51_01975 [Methyloversatilis sp. 12-65-5]|nr:MAG: hypothetical protein B7Z51_01975 [Methyloversatilis sp. 12-65-5]
MAERAAPDDACARVVMQAVLMAGQISTMSKSSSKMISRAGESGSSWTYVRICSGVGGGLLFLALRRTPE